MEQIWAAGAMSGTSLDGVDTAMVRTDGVDILEFGDSGFRPYTDTERATLRAALGKWHGEAGVAAAAETVDAAHIDALKPYSEASLIGYHGQTLAHAPRTRGTHQAGDGDALARALNKPVVWDFRSADVALGGEGAPLAPAFHFACAKWIGATAPVAFLNLGGVGNITWVNAKCAKVEDPAALLAFDTGIANAPMDDLVFAQTGARFDAGGALAGKGRVDVATLERAMAHSYYARMPPKSLDRNELLASLAPILDLALPDALATLSALVAASTLHGLNMCPLPPSRLLVTGGGRHNPAIMSKLAKICPCPVEPVEAVGLDGDMLEAQAFAYLAVRVSRGLPTSFPTTTGVAGQVGGGQVSRPPDP